MAGEKNERKADGHRWLYWLGRHQNVCAVQSTEGKHCPEPAVIVVKVNGIMNAMLCEKCYESVSAGMYGDMSVVPVRKLQVPTDEVCHQHE